MRSLATLAPLSAVCGMVTAFIFRRLGSSHIRRTVNLILAHLMELRLYLDEPRLVWNAQRNLLRDNLRLFRQIAVPSLIAAPLLSLVMWQAASVYGHAPLRAGEAVVVTAHVNTADLSDVRLEAQAGVAIETPGVRVPRLHEVSWRIRPRQPFSGRLRVTGGVERIDIPWPRATVLGVSWMIWFFGISTISALLAPRISKRRAALLVTLMFAHSAGAAEKTPVVLISIDTLRADHLSAYGYRKIGTPNIDSFADKGTIYLHIDSQIPLTMPSHASLMTSTYPFENRVEENSESLPPSAVTLASVLHASGYRTAAFIGSAMLDRRFGLDKDFDFYDSPFEAAAGQIPNPYSMRVRRDAALVTRAARQWIGENRGEPVFLFLHLYDLHTPYALPQGGGLTPSTAGYDAELEHVDQVLGRFREALARYGFWDRALVILLADHGESLGDHGETSHGYFIYESTMHVPLIIHWPAGAAKYPERVSAAGGLIDVAPTVLDFLHIAAPASFEGVSLLPGHDDRMIYGESIYPQETFGWAAVRSVQSGTDKYIDAPKAELYDLSKDPNERVNILPAHPAEARAMKARLDDLMARHPAPPRQPASEPSAHTREVLGSLGYTAGGKQAARSSPADPKDKLAEHEAYELGLTLLYSGRYDQAIVTLRRIVAADPRNLPALGALGEAYLRSGNAARALELWQQALERDPAYRPAAEFIGEYWLARKDYDKACRSVPAAPQCKGRQ
jgi:arylsulfatase A-like enzyme